MEMKDKNGAAVVVGATAVLLAGDSVIPTGSIGQVRDIRESHRHPGRPMARITKGDDENMEWSAWLHSGDFVVSGGGEK